MRSRKLHPLAGVLCVTSWVACTNPQTDNNGLIVGGTSDLPESDDRIRATVAVSILKSNGSEMTCSGILVHEQLVLTAAHCLDQGTKVRSVYFGPNGFSNAIPVAAADFRKHPQYLKDDPERSVNFDIGWVKLARPLPLGYQPVSIFKAVDELSPGQTVTLIGYGQESAYSKSDRQRRHVEVPILDVLSDENFHGRQLKGVINVGITPGRGSCYGDSGGPLFVRNGNRWQVAALTHGVDIFPDVDFRNTDACAAGKSAYVAIAQHQKWLSESSGIPLDTPLFTNPVLCPDQTRFDPRHGQCVLELQGETWAVGLFPESLGACPSSKFCEVVENKIQGRFVRLERRPVSQLPARDAYGCLPGTERAADSGGYCLDTQTNLAYGPFTISLAELCQTKLSGGNACLANRWHGDILRAAVGVDPTVYAGPKHWASLEGLTGEALAEAQAILEGTRNPIVQELAQQAEGKVIVSSDGEFVRSCTRFSQSKGCQMYHFIAQQWFPAGRCEFSFSAQDQYLRLLCRTDTGYACNPNLGGAVDMAVGSLTGILPVGGLVPGQTTYENKFSQGMAVQDVCPEAWPG